MSPGSSNHTSSYCETKSNIAYYRRPTPRALGKCGRCPHFRGFWPQPRQERGAGADSAAGGFVCQVLPLPVTFAVIKISSLCKKLPGVGYEPRTAGFEVQFIARVLHPFLHPCYNTSAPCFLAEAEIKLVEGK